jgi:hypothetical protein
MTGQHCQAKTRRTGEQCQRWAAPGKDVCAIHGGSAKVGRPPTHGWYSQAVRNLPAVRQAQQELLCDPALMEITWEIALSRALVVNYFDNYGEQSLRPKDVPVAIEMLETITRLVERAHRMVHGPRAALTARDLEAFVTQICSLAERHFSERVPDAYRAFLLDLRALCTGETAPRNAAREKPAYTATGPKTTRRRRYGSNAERQRAYRLRLRQKRGLAGHVMSTSVRSNAPGRGPSTEHDGRSRLAAD